jgi:hypothetical protein
MEERWALSPIPETWRSWGVWMAPEDKMISLFAETKEILPLGS